VIPANETFNGTFPFKPHFAEVAGFRMHYVDEGKGEPVVCLHGEPTWGYLFRDIIPRLACQYRVIVPDYMGFGKSETPQDREYTAKAHVDNLEALFLDLDLRNVTLVLHDWGGGIGGSVAFRHPERISRVVVTNSLLSFGLPIEAQLMPRCYTEAEYFRWMTQLYQNGALERVLSNFGVIILSVMKTLQGFERISRVDETWLRAYGLPFATSEESIGAISFPRSVVTNTIGLEAPNGQAAAIIRSRPAMMIEGMRDKVLLPQYLIPCFEAAYPNAPVYRLENAGHFLYEDEPDTIAALIEQFIRLT
jgi:haloalkane dehalogenase